MDCSSGSFPNFNGPLPVLSAVIGGPSLHQYYPLAPLALLTSNQFYPNFLGGQGPTGLLGGNMMAANNDTLTFTDLVVNITDPNAVNYVQPITQPDSFVGFSWDSSTDPIPDPRLGGTYTFDDISVLVEAARGNLDTQVNAADPHMQLKKSCIYNSNVGLATGGAVVYQAFAESAGAPDYQLAYQRLAMLESQPYATAIDGAVNGFFYKINELCDSRFGFVGFSCTDTGDGTSGFNGNFNPYSRGTSANVSYYYSSTQYFYGNLLDNKNQQVIARSNLNNGAWGGGEDNPSDASDQAQRNDCCNREPLRGNQVAGVGFRIPRIPIDWQNNNLNLVSSEPGYSQIPYNNPQPPGFGGDIWSLSSSGLNACGVWNGRPLLGTYTDEALDTALNMWKGPNYNYLDTSERPAARRAIVFFTDGEPTGGINGPIGKATTAISQILGGSGNAGQRNWGIALFTIGLNIAGTAQLKADQYQFLGDGQGGSGQGLAYYPGNGGKFFYCATGQDVRQAFTNVARRLAQNQE
jgi:hypothetical protein